MLNMNKNVGVVIPSYTLDEILEKLSIDDLKEFKSLTESSDSSDLLPSIHSFLKYTVEDTVTESFKADTIQGNSNRELETAKHEMFLFEHLSLNKKDTPVSRFDRQGSNLIPSGAA